MKLKKKIERVRERDRELLQPIDGKLGDNQENIQCSEHFIDFSTFGSFQWWMVGPYSHICVCELTDGVSQLKPIQF